MDNKTLEKIIRENEIEKNLILNVPDYIGEKIHKIITEQKLEDKNNYNIEIIENPNESISNVDNSRKMIFNFNGELHPLSILDLPCIIEGHKTIDYKSFYKGGDICQMMYVHDDKLKQEEDLNNFNTFTSPTDKNFSKLLWTKDPDHKYKLKHGLSAPTRNIRARRFKTKMKYNKDEILEVAKKLKSIIDNGAANYDNKTNKTLETYDNNFDDTNTVKSGINPLMSSKKKAKGKNDMNKSSNNILSIAFDENDTYNQVDESSAINKKKNKNKKKKNPEGDNGIIKIDFAPSVYEESIEEKKFAMKKELGEKYKALKDEYVKIKEKLALPEFAEDKALLNKKKKIKKELKSMKEQYRKEMV
jgi:TATA-binding protein-associated factor Taf7